MKEKTKFGNGLVTLTLMNPNEFEVLPNPTSVHCFPVVNNKILFTINPRGIDIIGGHVESGENALQALIREAKEEASIELVDCELIGIIEVDNSENPEAIKKGYPLKGYQFFYKTTKFSMLPFEETHECTGRMFVSKNEIPEKHHNWLKVHDAILEILSI